MTQLIIYSTDTVFNYIIDNFKFEGESISELIEILPNRSDISNEILEKISDKYKEEFFKIESLYRFLYNNPDTKIIMYLLKNSSYFFKEETLLNIDHYHSGSYELKKYLLDEGCLTNNRDSISEFLNSFIKNSTDSIEEINEIIDKTLEYDFEFCEKSYSIKSLKYIFDRMFLKKGLPSLLRYIDCDIIKLPLLNKLVEIDNSYIDYTLSYIKKMDKDKLISDVCSCGILNITKLCHEFELINFKETNIFRKMLFNCSDDHLSFLSSIDTSPIDDVINNMHIDYINFNSIRLIFNKGISHDSEVIKYIYNEGCNEKRELLKELGVKYEGNLFKSYYFKKLYEYGANLENKNYTSLDIISDDQNFKKFLDKNKKRLLNFYHRNLYNFIIPYIYRHYSLKEN